LRCLPIEHKTAGNANTVPAWVNDQAQLLLQLQWSPEQIASNLPISHETVYLRVYAD
jgi:IS30 family transposase